MKQPTLAIILLALSSLLLLPGCGGGGGGGGSQPITSPGDNSGGSNSGGNNSGGNSGGTTSPSDPSLPSAATAVVTVSPLTPSINVGDSIVLTSLAADKSGKALPSAQWTWANSNSSVAGMTSSGDRAVLIAKAAGTTQIVATEGNTKTASSPVTLTVTARPNGSPEPGKNSDGSSGTGVVPPGGSGSTPGGSGSTPGPVADSTVVYNSDFSTTPGPEWSDRTVSITPGTTLRGPTPFLGEFGNKTVSLTLGSLPAHKNVIIEADLFIMKSMDGNSTDFDYGPDIWKLSVDGGPTLLNTTFSNTYPALNSNTFPADQFQNYPDSYPGPSHPYHSGAFQVFTLGYIFGNHPADSVYRLKYTVPHTATGVKFNFTSGQIQGISDESWGLKNVRVSVVP